MRVWAQRIARFCTEKCAAVAVLGLLVCTLGSATQFERSLYSDAGVLPVVRFHDLDKPVQLGKFHGLFAADKGPALSQIVQGCIGKLNLAPPAVSCSRFQNEIVRDLFELFREGQTVLLWMPESRPALSVQRIPTNRIPPALFGGIKRCQLIVCQFPLKQSDQRPKIVASPSNQINRARIGTLIDPLGNDRLQLPFQIADAHQLPKIPARIHHKPFDRTPGPILANYQKRDYITAHPTARTLGGQYDGGLPQRIQLCP